MEKIIRLTMKRAKTYSIRQTGDGQFKFYRVSPKKFSGKAFHLYRPIG